MQSVGRMEKIKVSISAKNPQPRTAGLPYLLGCNVVATHEVLILLVPDEVFRGSC